MINSTLSEEKFILTFGYGNRKDYDAFLKYIDEFKVAYVVDVRLSPRAWTRKWYGDAIEKICVSNNIQYLAKRMFGKYKQTLVEKKLPRLVRLDKIQNLNSHLGSHDSSLHHRIDIRTG